MASAIKTARVNLFALLEAAVSSSLAGVQVTFGPPSEYEEQEVVSMLGVGQTDEQAAALGNGARREEFTIEVGIKAHDPEGTATDVDGRSFDIADAVRAIVRANRNLTGAVEQAAVVSQNSPGPQPAVGGGWVCFNTLGVLCKSRVT